MLDMPDFYSAAIAAYLALFAMMNPIGNTPVFLSVVGDTPPAFRLQAAIKVCIAVAVILVGSIYGGTAILSAFGISMNAFEAAGGIIVLGIGLKMLHGDENSSHTTAAGKASIADEERDAASKLIVPLSMPILGGPGSITTVVTVAAAHHSVAGHLGTAVGTVALVLTMFICFAGSNLLQKVLTPQVEEILVRFMGLILTAIAVGMFFQGLVRGTAEFIRDESPQLRSFFEESMSDAVDEALAREREGRDGEGADRESAPSSPDAK